MKKHFKIIILLSFFGLAVFSVYAINTVSTGYRVVNSSNSSIDAHSTCKEVTNSCGQDIFVPTKTSAEWQSFRDNSPGCMSTTSCTPVNGVCSSTPGNCSAGTPINVVNDYCVDWDCAGLYGGSTDWNCPDLEC